MKIKKEWVSWEELERYALSGIGGSFYTKTEINAMWEGYSGTKGQVAWANVTGKPGTFTPSVHASAHQAGGGDPLNNPLLLGASPVVNWQSGTLQFQTDEGDNTNTVFEVKGKGTGYARFLQYDQDNLEYLEFTCASGAGYIRVRGSSPGSLKLQSNEPQNVTLWQDITSGNPYLYIYGYQTGVGVKWGRDWVDASGIFNIQGQVGLKLNWPSYYADNSFLVANNKVADSDKWDGYQFADYLDQAVKQASSPTFAGLTLTGLSGVLKASTGVISGSAVHSDLGSITSDQHHAQLHASSHHSGGGDALVFSSIAGFGDYLDQAVKQASTPTFASLILGASPSIKWASGHLLLKTDEGTNTNTYVDIKGKGTGVGILQLFDADDAEWLELYESGGYGYFKTAGSSPHPLRIMHNIAQNVSIWELITAGNPNFDIHGWQTGVGVKYGRQWVASDGVYNLQGEVGLKLNFASYYMDTLEGNNKVYDSARLGGQLGSYYAPTTTKLDDWAEPDDTIDLDTSIARHGLMPKLINDYQQFLGGTGQWTKLVSSAGIAIYVLSKSSTTLRNSNDTERTTPQGSYTKLKETKLGEPTGVMKIEFTLESVGGETVYGRVYKNGVAIGTEQSTTTVLTWGEDLGGFDAQDLIQIYAYATLEDTVKVRNLRFKYDRAITAFGDWPIVVADYITTQDQTIFSMQNQDP